MSSCQYKKRISEDSEPEIQVDKRHRQYRGEHGLVWRWRWWIILVILCLVLYYVYTRPGSMGLSLTQLSPKIGPNEIDIRTDKAVQEIQKLFR